MRTTLTLDDDVAAQLDKEIRRTGRSLKETVNDGLRRGFAERSAPPRRRFKLRARKLGLRPGLKLDCVGDLIEHAEGSHHR